MQPVHNLERAFAAVTDYWSPKVLAQVNDQYIKIAKVKGEFVWHRHAGEDELFHVLEGRLKIQFEDGEIELGPGDVTVVPKGVLHRPVADAECWLMLVEPFTTQHTGDTRTPLTKTIAEQLGE
jgi:quercetin dioxygenase-like cupin family protein